MGKRALFLGVAIAASIAGADEAASGWPQWRGPLGNGVSPDGDPPIHWGEDHNVRFKVEIEGDGLASPIVWDDKIIILSSVAADDGSSAEPQRPAQEVVARLEWPPRAHPIRQRFLVTAYSREDGSILWKRTAAEQVPHESHYLDTSWACGSPITDGERVYAHFGSNGTYAFTMEGEPVWEIDLGDMTTRLGFGEGGSPTLYGDMLVVNWDHEGESFVVAVDKRTGKELWRTPRPSEATSWATPLVVEWQGGTPQVVIPATGRSRGYDLATGEELWSLAGLGINVVPTPTHNEGIVYLASGEGDGNMIQAVDLRGASGVLDGSQAVLWTRDRDTPYVATPLLYGDQLYFVKRFKSLFLSVDAATGEEHFAERLPGLQNIYASPVAASGRIYVIGREGEAVVLRHGTSFEVLAENSLDDSFDASPAIVGDVMYLRGRRYLYAIAR